MAKKYLYLIVLLIILPTLTAGCWNQVNVNETAIVSGIGIDFTDDGKIQIVTQLNKPVNQQTSTKTSQFVVASETGETIVEASRKIMLSVPRLPLWSHADVFIIGEKLAREDLSVAMDFAFRNRNIRLSNTLLISHNTSLDKLYNSDCPLSICSARGILKVLRTQERLLGIYVPVTLQEFLIKATTPGVDPFTPMVSVTKDLEENDILTINGTAVFKGQRMVGVLNIPESRGLFWLTSKQQLGAVIKVSLPEEPDIKVALELDGKKVKIRPRIEKDQIYMDITVEADFVIKEIVGKLNQQDPKYIEKIEKAAANEIRNQIVACIAKGQKLNSDFIGFGRYLYRYHPYYWEKIEADWYNYYPQVKTNIDVKTSLKFTDLVKYNIYQK